MKRFQDFLGGMMLGAALMFVLDPIAGRRRRHLIRDRMGRGGRELSDAADATMTRIRNRAQGLVAETRSRFTKQFVDDSVLEARVRAEMGHVISNPGAIAVMADNGIITLSGPVLAAEVDRLLSRTSAVPGVREVHSHLDVRTTADGISGLQGSGRQNEG